MADEPMRDDRGREVESIAATDAKNAFGSVLEKALTKGMVAITKRDRIRAVVLSVEAYDDLVSRAAEPLETLRSAFDALVAGMQTPRARKAGAALFTATPAALGRAAVKGARKRG